MHPDSEEEREMEEETEESRFQNHDGNPEFANQPDEDKYQKHSCTGSILKCVMSLFVGIVVGFVVEKSRGEIPSVFPDLT